MILENEMGLWLRPEQKAGKWRPERLMGATAAALTSIVTILAFAELTGFRALYSAGPMLAVACLVCAGWGVLSALERRNWFVPAVLALLLLLVLFGRQNLLEGLRLAWNQLGDAWTARTGRVLPALALQLDEERRESSLLLFSVASGAGMALIYCLLVSRWAAVLAVAVPGFLLGTMVWFGKDAAAGYLTAVLVLAVLMLLYGGWEQKKTVCPVLVNWMVVGVLIFIAVLAASASAVQNWTADVGSRVHAAVHESRYETQYTTLPEGDFRDYTASQQEAQPALVVNMHTPEAMYLRGFTGAEFDDDVWSALDPKTLAEREELLYWLKLYAFDPSAQFEAAASLTGSQTNVVTIQNLGACSQYMYVPFSLQSGSWLPAENLNEAADGNGQRLYVYNTVGGANNIIGKVLELLQNSDDPEVLEYRKAETAYRAFVSDVYLQIPEGVKRTLGTQWEAIAAQYGGAETLSREQAQACVIQFLSLCFPEEGTAYVPPLDIAAGTSYQYATVAAMTLRYFGFPARYAEGYIITDEMAAAAQDGAPIQVDSSHAAAWVEIYQDGIGWIPMELTPGFGRSGGSTEPDDSRNQSSASGETGEDSAPQGDGQVFGQPQSQLALPEQPPQAETQPETNNPFTLNIPETVLWFLVTLLILILLLILALVIRRKIVSDRREKRFRDENRREAAAWIFADTARLLENLGLDRGNGSMTDLIEPASRRFGPEYGAMLRKMTLLNARALFSSHPLDEDQRGALLEFRLDTIQRLKTESKWNQRLWMQWILCLY